MPFKHPDFENTLNYGKFPFPLPRLAEFLTAATQVFSDFAIQKAGYGSIDDAIHAHQRTRTDANESPFWWDAEADFSYEPRLGSLESQRRANSVGRTYRSRTHDIRLMRPSFATFTSVGETAGHIQKIVAAFDRASSKVQYLPNDIAFNITASLSLTAYVSPALDANIRIQQKRIFIGQDRHEGINTYVRLYSAVRRVGPLALPRQLTDKLTGVAIEHFGNTLMDSQMGYVVIPEKAKQPVPG